MSSREPLQPDEPGVTVSVSGTVREVVARAAAALGLQPEDQKT